MATTSNQNQIPPYLRPFFWDVDLEKLSVTDFSCFIIIRLMEHRDEKAVQFLVKTYTPEEMISVVKKSRSLSKRSRNFRRVFLGLENDHCTPKRYPTPYGDCCRD